MSAHDLRGEAVAVARLLASLREEGIVEALKTGPDGTVICHAATARQAVERLQGMLDAAGPVGRLDIVRNNRERFTRLEKFGGNVGKWAGDQLATMRLAEFA